jgi:AcrR family transcriptional regulator
MRPAGSGESALDDEPSLREADHKARLSSGMILAVAAKGYAETTIADIVRAARVSKRTFYQHYPDKEACFIATYGTISDALLARVAATVDAARDGEQQIEGAVRAYFAALGDQPNLLRPFLLDVHAAGPAALALRRTILRKFARLLRSSVERARRNQRGIRPLSAELALAIVGGINELILSTLSDGAADEGADGAARALAALEKPAIALIRAVVLPARR